MTAAKTPLPDSQLPPDAASLPVAPQEPVPPPPAEWILAAMIGVGVALGAAGAVAFVETTRYGPAPPAEEGANEWATPRPRPPKSASAASGSSQHPAFLDSAPGSVDHVWEEPIIDVEIDGDDEPD